MPAPRTKPETLRPDIAETFEEFNVEANRMGYIGLEVFPVFEAGMQAGQFPRLKLEDMLVDGDTTRTDRGGYQRDDMQTDKDTYATLENGREGVVDEREANVYAQWFDYEQVVARRTLNICLQSLEKRINGKVFNASLYNDTALGTAWNVFATADPIGDVEAARDAIFNRTGLKPNALIINDKVFRNLRRCEQIKSDIASTGAGDSVMQRQITIQQLQQALNIDRVIVADSAQNTGPQPTAKSISRVWSDSYAMVAKIATTNDLREPCIGRTFHWAGDGSQIGCQFEDYYSDEVRAQILRYRQDTDEKTLLTDAGQLLTGVSG